MSRYQTLFTGALVLLLFSSQTFATHPKHRMVSSLEEFLKGDSEGVSVTSDGKLVLSPAFTEKLDTKEAFVYSAISNRAGTLFLGTGNNGKVFRIPTTGPGEELAKLNEPGVYALAVDSKNRLYAASGPEGKVYRLDTEGKAEVFYDPGEKYIWDLAFDSSDNLYVATGPKGLIYRVDSSGGGSEFYDSEETHIVKLTWDLNQNLLAGTAPGGLLVRLDRTGKPFVVFDSTLEEIKAIEVDRYGSIYAAALSGGKKPSAEAAASVKATPAAGTETEESKVEVAGSAKGSKLELYRIDKDNLVQRLYSSNDELGFDLLVRNDGSVLLATGNKGRILAINPKGFTTLLVDSLEEQITQLVDISGSVYAAASNLGKVFSLEATSAEKGVFLSEAIDASMVSKWGTIRWRVQGGGPGKGIGVYTRTGNTKKPDRTWSDWQGPYAEPEGSPINSQPSQFLQWKVEFLPEASSQTLLGQDNAVEYVSVSYLQANAPPLLTSLTVHSPGVAFAKFPQANSSGGVPPGGPDGAHASSLPKAIRQLETPTVQVPQRKIYVPGSRSFSWRATDPNEDILRYSLHYRREGELTWRLLAEDLSDTEFTMDGASFADGTFQVRVVATDQLSNPPDLALESELVSKPFVVSNSAPSITCESPQVQGSSAGIRCSIESPATFIYQAEYSLDGEEWIVIFPADGIADQTKEDYRIDLKDLQPGDYSLRIRVSDVVGNLSSTQQRLLVQ